MEAEGRRVLITGATGFVAKSLYPFLASTGFHVRLAVREIQAARDMEREISAPASSKHQKTKTIDVRSIGTIDANTDWRSALSGVDVVIHLAARAHVMKDNASDVLSAFRTVNVGGSECLARQAAAAHIRRFVYVSSVKVNGEQTHDHPFNENDPPHPEDAYGLSKWEAEQVLWGVATHSSMEVVVLRPPLLYGPGVKGNFYTLMRAIARGVPIPIASVHNQRSLLYVGNLVNAILLCLDQPAAAGKTYLLADAVDLSSPDLARCIGDALGRQARLLPCPSALLKLAGAVAGRSAAMSRLLGSLQVDSGKIRRELGWRPCTEIAQGLAETARWYHRQSSLPNST